MSIFRNRFAKISSNNKQIITEMQFAQNGFCIDHLPFNNERKYVNLYIFCTFDTRVLGKKTRKNNVKQQQNDN